MLALLRIKNLAIIDGLELEFSPGLNIITGETGAGKSIIVGGLKLLLGEKADSGIVRRGEKEGVVEGLFEKGGNEFAVRRVISQDGKNRIYLNGSIASLKELRDFGGALAEISGQHAFQALLNRDAHIEILDSFAGIGEEVREFRDSYQKLLETRKRLNEKIEARRTADQKADLLRFQISEIGKSGLSDGLDERLEQESLLLRNAGKVKGGYDALIAVMESGENPLIDGANRALKILNDLKKYDPEAERFLPVFGNMLVELKEARREIERLNEKVVTDEGRLSEVEEKLSAIGKLKRKYGRTIGEILDFFGSSERELAAMENASGEIEELNKEAETLERRVLSEALKISDKRKKAAGVLSERVAGELQDLAMKGALFECRVEGGEGSLTENGFDKVEFLIETNPKEGLRPLQKIASGGELSRVMLAVKNVLHEADPVPLYLFDEVDAGISASVAGDIGEKLSQTAKSHQVIVITHMPQIAAMRGRHFVVSKEDFMGRAVTRVGEVAGERRVAEIARMLAGEERQSDAVKLARKMLGG